ncbi:hypothetical protein [Streptomyces platensis]|uniref:hypothetical protein n=1 Tax=Streptomyces platensis TaxID=58346 RepID=UPI0037AC168E
MLLPGGTWESYERVMRLHVLPYLGRKTIAQVTAADVEEPYARWAKGGAKPNTIDRATLHGRRSSPTQCATGVYPATRSRKRRSLIIRWFRSMSGAFRVSKRSRPSRRLSDRAWSLRCG